MKEHKIIDNFLSKSYHKEILELLSGPNFEWYYQTNITRDDVVDDTDVNQHGFAHWFIHTDRGMINTFVANFFRPLILQIQDEVGGNNILRARADMTMLANKEYEHTPHVDFPFPNISVIYYVNNSDGDTIIYKEKTDNPNNPLPDKLTVVDRVEPIANRLLIFDGYTLHTGSSPVNHKNRILINSNFEI